MNKQNAKVWIDRLQLLPHPEGGYYREVYRAETDVLMNGALKSACTSIYFLLQAQEISAFHRIASDELWHFYCGNAITIHRISPSGQYRSVTVGNRPQCSEVFQTCVPAGEWFGATVEEGYALVGCTVAPGFEFADFEMGSTEQLLRMFPQHKDIIHRLTLQ